MDGNYKKIHEVDADGIKVQYEVLLPPDDYEQKKQQFYADYSKILNEVERLTNNADGLDYALAASSGIISVFFPSGKFSLFNINIINGQYTS